MSITARHLVNFAPSPRYSMSRSRSPSRPSVTVSPGDFASGLAPVSTLMPGITPASWSAFTNDVPSAVDCRMVSSNRMTPEMNSPIPLVVRSTSR
jgi:hypothetical protein